MPFNRDSLNLEKQFTFYASYHNELVNIIIHLLCIWPILASAICLFQVRFDVVSITKRQHYAIMHYCFLQYTPAFLATPEFLSSAPFGHLVLLNGSFFLSLVYIRK